MQESLGYGRWKLSRGRWWGGGGGGRGTGEGDGQIPIVVGSKKSVTKGLGSGHMGQFSTIEVEVDPGIFKMGLVWSNRFIRTILIYK